MFISRRKTLLRIFQNTADLHPSAQPNSIANKMYGSIQSLAQKQTFKQETVHFLALTCKPVD